jgi:membrane protein DedA with SNARE-associated domain
VSVSHFISVYGPPVVFIVVFLEVFGFPFLPGEAALVTAAALAQSGKLTIYSVIGSATTGAILGQATAYILGRWRGRSVLEWGVLGRVTTKPLTAAEAFFRKHGGKAVFLGRFVPLLRSVIGWMAGVVGMTWWRYLAWNIAGALVWSFGIGLSAYFFGAAAVKAASSWGTIGIVVIAVMGVAILVFVRLTKRRVDRGATGGIELPTAAVTPERPSSN